MRHGNAEKSGRLTAPRLTGGFAGLAAILLLSACNSASGISEKFFNLNKPSNVRVLDESFLESGYCPPITIRPGTEALVVFATGDKTNENVRYQESITRTARECRYPGGQLTVKIGVAGRVAAGPKGAAGKVVVPVRIAVTKGETVAYSELQKIEVNLTAPELATDFAKVVNVNVPSGPNDRDVSIFVGFDEQGSAKKK